MDCLLERTYFWFANTGSLTRLLCRLTNLMSSETEGIPSLRYDSTMMLSLNRSSTRSNC